MVFSSTIISLKGGRFAASANQQFLIKSANLELYIDNDISSHQIQIHISTNPLLAIKFVIRKLKWNIIHFVTYFWGQDDGITGLSCFSTTIQAIWNPCSSLKGTSRVKSSHKTCGEVFFAYLRESWTVVTTVFLGCGNSCVLTRDIFIYCTSA